MAGCGDTTTEAWQRAFSALRVRLALAELKTTSAPQRAQIAAAIVIPKLLYVARHAWPTEEIITQADRMIRNFVWNAAFAQPEMAPTGWVKGVLSQQHPDMGGMGIPDLQGELIAMSASTVGEWATSTNALTRQVGSALQRRDGSSDDHVTPVTVEPHSIVRTSLRATGRPWVEWGYAQQFVVGSEEIQGMGKLRRTLRLSAGTRTLCSRGGLLITCEGENKMQMDRFILERKRRRGACMRDAITELPFAAMCWWNQQGDKRKLQHYRKIGATSKRKLKEVLQIHATGDGGVLFHPVLLQLPMTGADAHMFRELCLDVLANYPELLRKGQEPDLLRVNHRRGGQAPPFRGAGGPGRRDHAYMGSNNIQAIVGFREAARGTRDSRPAEPEAKWSLGDTSSLAYQDEATGGWKRVAAAEKFRDGLYQDWKRSNAGIADALQEYKWRSMRRVEGAMAYQVQNLLRLKYHRLKLWTGAEHRYECSAAACRRIKAGGAAHLIWGCPDATAHWNTLLPYWGMEEVGPNSTREEQQTAIAQIFSGTLQQLPEWAVRWGEQRAILDWDNIHKVTEALWALGGVITISAISRWNVDRVHPDGRPPKTLQESTAGLRTSLKEGAARYKMIFFPVTSKTVEVISIADMCQSLWHQECFSGNNVARTETLRVGFFDGGSRGNPGPGGSGSVILALDAMHLTWTPVWAAATALGHQTTTNNVAEFVGLNRLLQKAAKMSWRGTHVVGDSAMIINMMRTKKAPKSRKLLHWYRLCRKLADISGIGSWKHHYRNFNKMADGLANDAMDNKRSTVMDGCADHALTQGVLKTMPRDINHWVERRK